MLDAKSNITIADMQALQGDHHSNWGARMVPFLIDSISITHPDEAATLQAWSDRGFSAASGVGDGVSATEIDDSVATSIFNAWAISVRKRTFQDEEIQAGLTLDYFQAANTL